MRLFFVILLLLYKHITVNGASCRPNYDDTIAEVVEKCRNKEGFANLFESIKLENMSNEDFYDIFGLTKSIQATLEIVDSTAKQMIFPQLTSFIIQNSLSFHHNAQLEYLSFPKLWYFINHDGHMSISHNPKLGQIYFSQLNVFHFKNGNLTIVNNSELKSIKMAAIYEVLITELRIVQNPTLHIIELDGEGQDVRYASYPRTFKISGKLVIAENDMLERVDFRVKMEEMPVTVHGMEIRKNRRLKSVPFVFNASNIEMRIEGNPRMSRKVLEGLRTAANLSLGRIQDYGECIMEEKIRQLAILDDCLYIYGDLILAAGARGAASGRLTRVEGNVYTSDLSLARLKFLLDADIYGRFESDLCDFDYSPFKSAKKGVRKSCTEAETTTEVTTTTTTIKSTEKLTTERETTGTTEGREEATSSIVAITVSTTVTVEETVITSTIREEMSTGEEPTEDVTHIIPTTESLREFTSTQNSKAKQSVPTRILITCAAAVFIILLVGSAALLCYRKSKKKEEPKIVEVSPNTPSSDSTSSRPTPQPASKSPGL